MLLLCCSHFSSEHIFFFIHFEFGLLCFHCMNVYEALKSIEEVVCCVESHHHHRHRCHTRTSFEHNSHTHTAFSFFIYFCDCVSCSRALPCTDFFGQFSDCSGVLLQTKHEQIQKVYNFICVWFRRFVTHYYWLSRLYGTQAHTLCERFQLLTFTRLQLFTRYIYLLCRERECVCVYYPQFTCTHGGEIWMLYSIHCVLVSCGNEMNLIHVVHVLSSVLNVI